MSVAAPACRTPIASRPARTAAPTPTPPPPAAVRERSAARLVRRAADGPWVGPAYRTPVEPVARVRYRSRSRAISAMWWMNSMLLAQMTLMNGNSAASLQGYWQ